MKYQIKGSNISVTRAIEDYVETRLEHLAKYFVINEDTVAKVLITVYKKGGQKIETTIPTKYGILRAESTESDLYAAIDASVEKLESQIRKYKTKIKRNKSKEHLGHAFDFESIPGSELEEKELDVVKTKSINPRPKDLETAILNMEMLNHSFYIFRDLETEKISVVYKRNDGGYGLIETE